jgi:predicted aspartyl protease
MIAHKRFSDLDEALRGTSLDPVGAAYYDGIAANSDGRVDRSISLLAPVTRKLGDLSVSHAILALETLSDDYAKAYEYAQAASIDDLLLTRYGSQMTTDDLQGIRPERKQWYILRQAPAQHVHIDGPFSIALHRDRLGLREAGVTAGTVQRSWIVDTGASLSTITESEARRVGAVVYPGATTIQNFLGENVRVHMGTVPRLRLGAAVVSSAVVFVMADRDLYIPQLHVQINGILGFGVLRALRSIVFTREGLLYVAKLPTGPVARGRMYFDNFTPIVSVRINGIEQLCSFDTGAEQTTMDASYYLSHAAYYKYTARKRELQGSAGGTLASEIAIAPIVAFAFGRQPGFIRTFTLRDVAMNERPVRDDQSDYAANIGSDLYGSIGAYGFDFERMQFIVQ